jgi:nucleoside-diphosphate-sugar epimerase
MSGGRGDAPVLVTGANGFVGRHVCEALAERKRPFRMLIRREAAAVPTGAIGFHAPDLLHQEALRPAVSGCRAVIHLAARVHVMEDYAADPLAEFRRVNVEGTRCLARCAVEAGVRRFVFVSSIKVNGESTARGSSFRESDAPAPEDPYGRSKWEAEQALWEIAAETGLEVAILRPPLIYGPGVKANFLRLMRLVHRGVPLPLGAARNRRNLAFVRNVADAVVVSSEHPRARGETLLVSDYPAVSSAELVKAIATVLGRRALLLPIPPVVLRAAGALTGKRAAVDRLLGSLEVESGRVRDLLGWQQPHSMEEGLRETAEWFLATERSRARRVQ